MPLHNTLRPVTLDERHEILDVLRGFALLGVLIANLLVNLQMGRAGVETPVPPTVFDRAASVLMTVFVGGKFLSLFGLLFGYGFAVQALRAEARGISIVPVYARRLGWLFVFGACNMLFGWWGDILMGYAVGGLLLLLLYGTAEKKILTIGVGLWVVSAWIFNTRGFFWSMLGLQPITNLAETYGTYAGGSYLEIIGVNLHFYRDMTVSGLLPLNHSQAWALFLLGYLAGRRRWLVAPSPQWYRRLKTAGLVGLGVGLALAAAAAGLETLAIDRSSAWNLLTAPVFMGNVPAFVAFYVMLIAFTLASPRRRRLITPFASVGRMALTNYLMQSLAYVVLLFGPGLGLLRKIGPAAGLGLALLIFAAQILFSRFWLGRFRYGPAEWLWRRLTYGRFFTA